MQQQQIEEVTYRRRAIVSQHMQEAALAEERQRWSVRLRSVRVRTEECEETSVNDKV